MQQKTRPFEPGFLTKEETETNRAGQAANIATKLITEPII
jgi:hypothetical protein